MSKKIRLSIRDKENITHNLGVMLASGVDVQKAISSMLENSKGNMKKALAFLQKDLDQGISISESFKNSGSFEPVTLSLINAGEESGTLSNTLKVVADNYKNDLLFTGKVKQAMIYPALIISVFIMVLLTILIFVIPRIAIVFNNLKVQMPLPTRILIFASDILLKETVYVVAALILIILIIVTTYHYKKSALFRIFTSLPFISKLFTEIDIARFTSTVSVMLNSGITLDIALVTAKTVAYKYNIQKIINKCYEEVLEGKSLTQSLRNSKLLLSSDLNIIESGESSGNLSSSLKDISDEYLQKTTATLATIITLIEPVMLVVIGILIGSILMSIITPIYQLIGNIGV